MGRRIASAARSSVRVPGVVWDRSLNGRTSVDLNSRTEAQISFRSAASFGKRQEFIAITELLRLGFDVYLTLVDDQQIDCVVRMEEGNKLIYLDIQIKARSKDCNPRNAGTFAALEVRKPRPNFFFIFYSEQAGCYWVMPSRDLIKEVNQAKSGKSIGRSRLVFTNQSSKTGLVKPRPRFEKYRNNFELLRDFKG